ncbi:MAG: DUF2917 domain-containing protein [Armatimonadota bacterium]
MIVHLQSVAAEFPRVARDTTLDARASSPIRMVLESGAVLSVQARSGERRGWSGRPQPAGMRVRCLSGELWVTQAGDLTDHRLRAGESLETAGAGALVVQALTPATLTVAER